MAKNDLLRHQFLAMVRQLQQQKPVLSSNYLIIVTKIRQKEAIFGCKGVFLRKMTSYGVTINQKLLP